MAGIHYVDIAKLSWDRSIRTLSAEASTLGLPPGAVVSTIVVDATLKEFEFVLLTVEKDGEGDITHWTYGSQPGILPVRLIVWND